MSTITECDLTDLVHLMQIPTHKRQQKDIQHIARLTKVVKFFNDYDESVHEACCHLMKYAEYPTGAYIFKKGNPGDSFCIIIKGRVGVLIPSTTLSTPTMNNIKRRSTRDNTSIPTARKILSFTRNLFAVSTIHRGSAILGETPVFAQPTSLAPIESCSQIEISELGAGASFGELSLLQDAPRSASIICKEPTILAVLSKESFNVVLKEYEARKLNEKIVFIRSIPAFQGWSRQAMSKLTYYLKERKYKRSSVIYDEGDAANEVFIVLEGEFKLTKTCKMQKESSERTVKTMMVSQSQLQVVIKGVREVFGDNEVINDQPRSMKCTCVSTVGRLWAIAKFDFMRRVQSVETWNYLYKRNETQKRWITQRLDQLLDIEEMKYRPSPDTPKSPVKLASIEVSSLKSRLKLYSNTVLDLPRSTSTDLPLWDHSPLCRHTHSPSDGSVWAKGVSAREATRMDIFMRKAKKARNRQKVTSM